MGPRANWDRALKARRYMDKWLSQNDGTRRGAAVVVEGGELINPGRRFPGQAFVRVAGAEECFVGEPVEFSHATFRLGAKRDRGGIFRSVRNRYLACRQIDFGRVPAARQKFVIQGRRKRRRQSSRHTGSFK